MVRKHLSKVIGIAITSVMIFSTITIKANAEWISTNDKWWYKEGNSYATGWRELQDKDQKNWYYFDSDGYMKTGWLKDGEKWYFFYDCGKLTTGWMSISGKKYYFGNDGVMMSYRTKLIDDKMYYFLDNGEMATGWQNIYGNCWVYAYPDGHMAINETINGYYLNKDGEWYS